MLMSPYRRRYLKQELSFMKNALLILKTEIEKELRDLERLRDEMSEVLKHPAPSFLETRAAGSILHDFYSGIEKIFRRIAAKIDRDIPSDEDWHTELLIRRCKTLGIMMMEILKTFTEEVRKFLGFIDSIKEI